MGVDCNAVLSELDTAINQLPKVSGGSGAVYVLAGNEQDLQLRRARGEVRR